MPQSEETLNQGGGQGALCFVVDDEPAISRFIAIALRDCGVASEQFTSASALVEGLRKVSPALVFLDVSLGDSDAIEAIRGLAAAKFPGSIQLMSGRDSYLLEEVRRVGERYGLRMLSPLQKPFRVDIVRRLVESEHLSAASAGTVQAEPARRPASSVAAGPKVDLGEALRRNWLELWYQPKLDLRRGRLVGAEGLARVRHPEHGIILPGGFIPQASDADLTALAEHALHEALRDARDFADAGHELRLAINVPVEALLNLPIPAIVREYRSSRDTWVGIILEVTEDQVIRDIATAHEIATQLRIYQIDLAIDDFGRGYSSFSRLKELPFAELKLDQSFVENCAVDPTNAALCRTAVDLAHRFGSLAVAEGIEKPTDLAAIARTGCDIAQGFIFAHAMPKEFLLARMMADGADGGFGATITALGDVGRGAASRFRASA